MTWTCAALAASASQADKDAAETLATNALWALSGRVFGVCPEVVRPCFSEPRPSTYNGRSGVGSTGSWFPGLINGSWATGGCGCASNCGCVGKSEVALPGPVDSVTAVWVDGELLDPSAYRVRDRRWLIRCDGGVWPQNQDLCATDHAAGAFTVEYQRGIPVPAAGLVALNDYACELLKARTNGGKCVIPARAQEIARQGMNITLTDPSVLAEAGLTGVESVDRWLAAVNPHKRRQPARVYSPDAPRVVRVR